MRAINRLLVILWKPTVVDNVSVCTTKGRRTGFKAPGKGVHLYDVRQYSCGEISLQWQIREGCQIRFLVTAQMLLLKNPSLHIQSKLQELTWKTNEYKASFSAWFYIKAINIKRLIVGRCSSSLASIWKCYVHVPWDDSGLLALSTTN